jgi:hypothetical protein
MRQDYACALHTPNFRLLSVTQLLSLQPDVDAFENRDLGERPWIYRIGDESLT